eukprot:jgi/Astpho2/7184/Aster-x0760
MDVTDALQRCPFLSRINREKGPSYAGNIATRPAQPADRMGCPFKHSGDALAGLSASFELFHGDRGVLPLHRGSLAQGCPVQHGSQEASAGQHRVAPGSMPVAAISLSGFRFLPGFDDVFGSRSQHRRRKQQQRPKPGSNGAAQAGSSSTAGPTAGPSSSAGTGPGNSGDGKPLTSSSQARPPGGAAGKGAGSCPLRSLPGVLGGLVPLSAKGELTCPRAVVAARAFVAKMKPVRDLRPQALPVKKLAIVGAGTRSSMLAIGAAGAGMNIPFGMWRSHTRKFSPEWFLAVHASIPFISLLRKGVIMPKWAFVLTVAAAVAGQKIGATLEQQRLGSSQASGGPSLPDTALLPVVGGSGQGCMQSGACYLARTQATSPKSSPR